MIDQAEKLRRIVNNLNKNLPRPDNSISNSVNDKEGEDTGNVRILEEKGDLDVEVTNQTVTIEPITEKVNDTIAQAVSNIQNQEKTANVTSTHRAKVITVTSGKGGVGKTSITANLALSLSQKGYRVVIVDADLGLSNIDVVFGIVPRYSLLELIKNEKGILDILCDGPNNIKFISGGSGVKELVKLDQISLDAFIANMSLLDHIADYILIDTGAGLSETVMNFVLSADEVILVITPEPTSITDAYALVKTISFERKSCSVKVLINRAENENEAKSVFNNFAMVADRFLGMRLESLGYLPFDQLFTKSVKLQKPYLMSFPKNSTSKLIAEVADQLISKPDYNGNHQSGIKGFINRFVGLFSN